MNKVVPMKKNLMAFLAAMFTVGAVHAAEQGNAYYGLGNVSGAVGDTLNLPVYVQVDTVAGYKNAFFTLPQYCVDYDPTDVKIIDWQNGPDGAGATWLTNETPPFGAKCDGDVTASYIAQQDINKDLEQGVTWFIAYVRVIPLTTGTHPIKWHCAAQEYNGGDLQWIYWAHVANGSPFWSHEYHWGDTDFYVTDGSVTGTTGGGGCRPPCELEKPGAATSNWSNIKELYR